MREIKITKKDGSIERFQHRGRAGGSYSISLRYEGGFVIVENEWGDTTAFPAADIEKVETAQERGW